MMQEKHPTRVLSIDIIRGFALIGIFFVNVPMMQRIMSFDTNNSFEAVIRLFYDIFIQTNFYVIFSLLFGVSAYYFMRSQEMKGLAYKKLFLKRSLWLLVFGAVHYIFIWFGDILHSYALIGFILPLFYKISPTKILISAALLFMISFGITQLPNLTQNNMDSFPESVEDVKDVDIGSTEVTEDFDDLLSAAAMNTSYMSVVKKNLHSFVLSLRIPINLEILSLALLGLGLAKANFFEEFIRYRRMMRIISIFAFLMSIPVIVLMVRDFMIGVPIANHFYVWASGKLLAIVYLTVLLWACENVRIRQKLAPLASYGKMAFTNYLSQSIITVFIVTSVIKDFTLQMQFFYCIVFLILQVYISTMIMKKHKYGPFEFVWRKLVFGRKLLEQSYPSK